MCLPVDEKELHQISKGKYSFGSVTTTPSDRSYLSTRAFGVSVRNDIHNLMGTKLAELIAYEYLSSRLENAYRQYYAALRFYSILIGEPITFMIDHPKYVSREMRTR
jgi:hypothetical protein